MTKTNLGFTAMCSSSGGWPPSAVYGGSRCVLWHYHRRVFIPLGTDRDRRRPTLIAFVLVGVMVAIHLVLELVSMRDPDLRLRIWDALDVGGVNAHPWGLVTAVFLHAGWLHLLGNCVFLLAFGPPVEDRFGRGWFLLFFLAAGVASGGVHWIWSDAPAIGASGAIAGVTGAFLVLFPRTNVRCLGLIFLGVFYIPAWIVIGMAVAWDVIGQTALAGATNIAYTAHLGGYVFGASVALVLLITRVIPREPYDLFSIARQAHRRRQFAAATTTAGPSRPERALRAHGRTAERTDELAAERADIAAAVSANELDRAAELYAALRERHARDHAAVTMPRNTQYALAAHLTAAGDHQAAADAFGLFLDAYPADREADQVRVIRGRLLGRYLGEAGEAEELLRHVLDESPDDELREIAREELAAIGVAP